jgi:CheY-like chemotaxis protein
LAATVREAVETVVEAKPDVVVTDIAMPGEDGYALVRRLRAIEHERGGHVPVIAVTALASAEDRKRAMSEGRRALDEAGGSGGPARRGCRRVRA